MNSARSRCLAHLASLLIIFGVHSRASGAEGDLWIAVGDSGRRVRSTDGVTWTHDQKWPPEQGPLVAVAAGLGRFIAVGGTAHVGRIVTSPDGQTWRELPPFPQRVDSIAFGQGRFVAASGSQLLVSTDGETFQPAAQLSDTATTPAPGTRSSQPESGGDQLTARTPLHTITGTMVDPASLQTQQIAAGDTEAGYRFVLVGEAILTADSTRIPWRAVTGDGSRLEHFAFVTDDHTLPIEDRVSSDTPLGPPVLPASPVGLAYGAGHFVLIGSNCLESSHDGQTWIPHPCPGEQPTSLVWTGTRFLATTPTALWISPDALTWQRESSPAPRTLLAAQELPNNHFWNLSPLGVLSQSTNLQTWHPLSPIHPLLRALAHGRKPQSP